MYDVQFARSVLRTLKKLPRKVQEQIFVSAGALATEPRPHGIEKLSGGEFFRIRTGDYRIVFDINDKNRRVTIVRVGDRKEVYRIDMKELNRILQQHGDN